MDLVPPGWAKLVGPGTIGQVGDIGRVLVARAETEEILPDPHLVFRALRIPPDSVRVLLVGQDPYPTPGHAEGLSFSVPEGVWPLPPTLRNIRTELASDLGIALPRHGHLGSWHRQGVLLLNRHLTTVAHKPGGHHQVGWAEVTDRLVEALAHRQPHLVSILWGAQARQVAPLLGHTPTITSAHPSPLSAAKGFFGSRPFSTANRYLEAAGVKPIDWSLPPASGCQPD